MSSAPTSTPIPTSTSDTPPAQSSSARDGGMGNPPTGLAVTVFIAAFAVIFVLFGGFLVLGLVRRRRNPDRYGPRPAVAGRARQTRKKGLAMAVLESLPVVRFGANNKTTEEGPKDVELAGGIKDDDSNASANSREITENTGAEHSHSPASHQAAGKDAEIGTGTECSICLADFVESEEVRVLPCSHRFHPACIDPWLLDVSGTCPICRYDLEPAQPAALAGTTTATTTSAPATLAVPAPTAPRDRTSFRSRLREIRQAHTGTEYTSALRRLYHDHENPRRSVSIHTAEVTPAVPQESRPT